MDNLLDARAIKLDLAIVGITKAAETEDVVTAALRLHSELSTRACELLRVFTSGFFVTLNAIVDLERRCTSQDEVSGDTSIPGTVLEVLGPSRKGLRLTYHS